MKRIVKLIIKSTEAENFVALFKSSKDKILSFEGCHHVELLRARGEDCIFFTYSYWEEEKALKRYRESDTFKKIWKETKLLFDGKPEAWSMDEIA